MPTADGYERMLTPTKRPAPLSPFKKPSVPTYSNYTRPASTSTRSISSSPAPAPYYGSTDGYRYSTGGSGGTGSYGGGSGSYGGGAPAAPSEQDYLAGDASYQAQLAALLRALKDFQADDTAQRTKYETDYSEGLRMLGWTPDDPKTADLDESKWNWEDQLTASGRAYQGQLNDFASRGMLQSSAYGRSVNDLQRSFNDQLGSVNRARTDFLSERDRALAAYKNENTMSQQQSRAEAIARRAAQYGL